MEQLILLVALNIFISTALVILGTLTYHIFVVEKLTKEVRFQNRKINSIIKFLSQPTPEKDSNNLTDSLEKKENTIMSNPFATVVKDFDNISWLRNFVVSEEGQEEITTFSETLIEMMNSEEKYLAVCEKAQADHIPLTEDDVRTLVHIFKPAFAFAGPGHDLLHTLRDLLGTFALLNDPFMQNAAFSAELDAGILGGFHDVGSGLISRYQDTAFASGHCEIGAWFVFHSLINQVERNKLLLACYAINGHQHQTADKTLPNGYTRQHHVVELFFAPDDDKKASPIGVAVLMTRYADRQENLGAGTHFARHIVAMGDAQEAVGDTADYDGTSYWSMKGEALTTMFEPTIRVEWKWGVVPTLLEHALLVYGHSQFGAGAYSKHDRNFPVMITLMDENLSTVYGVRNVLFAEPDCENFDPAAARNDLKAILRRVNNSSSFPLAWMHIFKAWGELSETVQAKWQAAAHYMNEAYEKGLLLQLKFAKESPVFADLAKEIFETVI